MNKRGIVIFGAHGFIAHHLIPALAKQGYPLIALARRHAHISPGVELHVAPFDTPAQFTPLLERAHTLVHVASCSTPGTTAGKPLVELSDNLRPTLALLEAWQNAPHCRLLYVSSGGTLYGDTNGHPADENMPPRPRSYYGAAKAAAECFIHAATQQFALSATLLRPSNLYGPGQEMRGGFGIIPTAFAHAQRNEPLTIWGDGGAIRDYLYIDDFIRLCLDIIRQPMPIGAHAFNVASGHPVSLMELLEHIQTITGKKLSIQYDVNRPVDIARIELDTRKIRTTYAWQPQVSLEEGLTRTWQWWQTHNA